MVASFSFFFYLAVAIVYSTWILDIVTHELSTARIRKTLKPSSSEGIIAIFFGGFLYFFFLLLKTTRGGLVNDSVSLFVCCFCFCCFSVGLCTSIITYAPVLCTLFDEHAFFTCMMDINSVNKNLITLKDGSSRTLEGD